ncbi:hypothetical protein SAMN05444320_102186 [Streptoalloteichus hindustanus]|uniref:Antitoxin FitA-like ribbon-helix-helix domain-containing protein n=2 Tax=Streptoalloteichus hindustanus TaxID=2017 RepID=A0A1M4Y0J9_STRHI|nr:hypothetical protein SAMN05444320_102186 [Streptoalloteichus hindustanus]
MTGAPSPAGVIVCPLSARVALQRYSRAMATIQIRDVPEEAYEVIRQRARAAGQSIQSYMREQVIEMARQRTKQEVLAEIEAALAEERPRNVTAESLAAHVAAERR